MACLLTAVLIGPLLAFFGAVIVCAVKDANDKRV